MTGFSVRRMRAADIEAVMTLAGTLKDAPHWPRSAYEAALDPAVTPQRIALVAEASGSIAGFTVASLVPPEAELETIAVAKPLIRCKVGSVLFAALTRELITLQITELMLEVRASNAPALAFYRAHSLVEYTRRKGYYADTGEDAILMRGIISDRRNNTV